MSMLSVKAVSQRLGLCKMTVYRLIHGGKLPAIKVGKSYRISSKDFQEYLRKVRTDVPQAGRAGAEETGLPPDGDDGRGGADHHLGEPAGPGGAGPGPAGS